MAMCKTARLSALSARCDAYKRPVFPLSGGDVLAAGIPAGKRVGEVLAALEALWVERNFALGRAELAARLGEMVKDSG